MDTVDSIYLLELARDRSATGRKRLGEVIAQVFSQKIGDLTEREQALMFDILRRVIHDMEMSVRVVVSRNLALLPEAPRDLCRTLVNDSIEVAFPILVQSEVVKDEDLIGVVRDRTLEHQLAISIRDSVSEEVSAALVEAGKEQVVQCLLNNHGARISQATMEYLVEESRRVDSFQEPILRRDDLDPQLAKRMYMWVSAALRKYVLERFEFDHVAMDELLEKTALEQSAWQAAPKKPTKTDQLAQEIRQREEIGPEILIEALKIGEVGLFVSLFEQASGVPQAVVRRILFDCSTEGLIVACKSAALDEDTFWSIRSLSRLARPTAAKEEKESRSEILARYRSFDEKAARAISSTWSRDADYLTAIRQLQDPQHPHGR